MVGNTHTSGQSNGMNVAHCDRADEACQGGTHPKLVGGIDNEREEYNTFLSITVKHAAESHDVIGFLYITEAFLLYCFSLNGFRR